MTPKSCTIVLMPVKAPRRLHYTHKKPAKHFVKVYWPYLPLMLTIGLTLLTSNYWRPLLGRHGVLAYATSMSREELLSATNKHRQANGRANLAINEKLNTAAQAKAKDMAEKNYWAHVAPDGTQPWYFFDQAGYKYFKAGENLAYGFLTSDSTVTGWMNSQSHKENLLDEHFQEVGFGYINVANYQDKGEETIIVALYGKPLVASASTTQSKPAAQTPVAPKPKPKPAAATPLQIDYNEALLGNALRQEVPSKQISAIQAATKGYAPWSSLAVASLLGGLVVYMLLKHGLALRRALVQSERFILHHPLLDITALAIITFGILMSQTAGIIR